MAPINIDVSQSTPPIEPPPPVRANNKADSSSFDSHLQRASEQRPGSSATTNSTSSDSHRNRQDSPPQKTQADNASSLTSSAPPVKSESDDSQLSETSGANDSETAQPTDATVEKPNDTDDEATTEPVATSLTLTQPPVVAVVESATPVPVAVAGSEKEPPKSGTPVAGTPTEPENLAPVKPVGHDANCQAIHATDPVTPKLEKVKEPAEVSPTINTPPAADEAVVTDTVSESEDTESSDPTDEVAKVKAPETPKISSMHRYDVRQPATSRELPQEVHSDENVATESKEPAEKVNESKPTGRRSERNKKAASDSDDTPKHTDADPRPNNSAPMTTPAQVAAAAAVVAADPASQPGDTSSQPATDAGAAPAVAEVSGPTATQAPDAPPTRPLPAEPAVNVSRTTGGHQQVEHKHNSELSESDRARFVQRVTKAFQTASERGGPLKLRLSPPELGSVRMEVSLKDGALSARLEAETPAARAALLENLPMLRERLAEQNVRIEKFDVDVQDQTSGGPGNGATSDPDTDRNPRSPLWRGMRREQESAAIAAAPVPVGSSGLDQLNVVI